MDSTQQDPVSEVVAGGSFRELWQSTVQRMAQGDVGALPVILALTLIAIIFQIANHHFLTALNLANLMVQISATGTLAVGVTLVLLIGEIDLSVGAVSGFTAGIMAVLSAKVGLPAVVSVLAGILAGALIGLFQGFWFTKLHVPSFVVTLAGYLGWQGALLWVLGTTGTVNLNNPLIVGLANTRLPVAAGWALAIVFIVAYAASKLSERLQRTKAGMEVSPFLSVAVQIAIMAVALLAATYILNVNRTPLQPVSLSGASPQPCSGYWVSCSCSIGSSGGPALGATSSPSVATSRRPGVLVSMSIASGSRSSSCAPLWPQLVAFWPDRGCLRSISPPAAAMSC